jgi:prepilin-type N-terminal cleavage/methylation domain-containing protein/prepilin-type processing-associated H-X9-DG protein
MANQNNKAKGFTLIELLVVIAVIALLMAIVIPALGKAKIYAQKVVCRSNVRQLGLGILLYADQNDGEVPVNTRWNGGYASWFWDSSFWMTDRMSEYGGLIPDVFFCPSAKNKKPDDARWWQYSITPDSTSEVGHKDESGMALNEKCQEYRVLPYIFLIDLIEMNPSATNFGKSYRSTAVNETNFQWIRKLTNLRNTGTREMVMDSVISGQVLGMSANAFNEIQGGAAIKYGLTDSTNHLTRQSYSATNSCPINEDVKAGNQPDGGNIGYADGHVDWRPFDSMRLQMDVNPDFYW